MICTKKCLSVSPEVAYRTHPNYICTTMKDMFLLRLWKATCYTNTPTTSSASTTTSMLARLHQLRAVIHTTLSRSHSWSLGQIFRGIKRNRRSRKLHVYENPALRFIHQAHKHMLTHLQGHRRTKVHSHKHIQALCV